jgi:hypothetical protein
MSKNKAIKITGMTLGLMIGTMIAGAGLATAGWWYSDRLNLAFAEPAGINAVKAAGKDCEVGQTGTITYTTNSNTGHPVSPNKVQIVECVDGDTFDMTNPWGFVKNVYVKMKSGSALQTQLVKREEIKNYQKDDGGWVGTGTYKINPKESRNTSSKWVVKETMTDKQKAERDAAQAAAAARQKAANSKAAAEKARAN